jgi:E3 ubiquitin-protein ligase RAD18
VRDRRVIRQPLLVSNCHPQSILNSGHELSEFFPDQTDFPPHAVAPGLRGLDGSFRCDICGDLYDAPVTKVACGHCFCSAVRRNLKGVLARSCTCVQCIRVSLINKQECPSCRKPTLEAHIRLNPALDKVISDWKSARYSMLAHRSHVS